MGTFDRVLDEIAALTPAEGWSLVGVDRFELPGEALYLIDTFTTRKEAEEALACRRSSHPSEELHLYGHRDASTTASRTQRRSGTTRRR